MKRADNLPVATIGTDREKCDAATMRLLLLACILVAAFSGAVVAQDEEPVAEPVILSAGLDPLAAADTVRTNIWLVEALMGETFKAAARAMPPPPAAVRLIQLGEQDTDELARVVALRVLGDLGYDLFLPVEDPAKAAAVDYEFAYRVQSVDLEYPGSERTLGIWRRWVSRRVAVSTVIEINEADSGRLVFSDRVTRELDDRVSAGHLGLVESDLHTFTSAATAESGWHSRLEEFVVLGTLTGLIVVYFANTGD